MPLPTILSGNVASALPTGFNVDNSCRFNRPDSPYMHITPGGDGNLKIFTVSFWVKRVSVNGGTSGTDREVIFSNATNDQFSFHNDKFEFLEDGSTSASTNMLFRDFSGWYHIVAAFDTSQATNTNRNKYYVNGKQIDQSTGFSTMSYVGQDVELGFGKGSEMMSVGRSEYDDNRHFNGYLAEFYYINGTMLDHTSFGEFDEDSPTIWKPKKFEGSFGTNGFYLDFEDSSNLGNDANGGTDLTEVNLAAVDQATDSPTNNFCVLNSNNGGGTYTDNDTYSEGNTIMVASDYSTTMGTFGVTNGKWYWEAHIVWNGTSNNANFPRTIGIIADDYTFGYSYLGQDANSWGMNFVDTTTDIWKTEHDCTSGSITGATTMANGDVMMFALDMDNGALYFGRGGTWYTSGDPTSGASKTGAVITLSAADMAKHILPALTSATSGTYYKMNFGNPAFTISSGNSDGAGYGNFEYAVPSGYYALCTKNLAEYG